MLRCGEKCHVFTSYLHLNAPDFYHDFVHSIAIVARVVATMPVKEGKRRWVDFGIICYVLVIFRVRHSTVVVDRQACEEYSQPRHILQDFHAPYVLYESNDTMTFNDDDDGWKASTEQGRK